MSDRRFGWKLVGLSGLGSVAAGLLLGQQASAEMAPFYANLASVERFEPRSNGVEIVSADGSSDWVETSDLAYPPVAPGETKDAGY